MNVRVGDIIKLENNQFVAVSLAPKRARPWLGSARGHGGLSAHAAFVLLCHLGAETAGFAEAGSCFRLCLRSGD